MMVMILIIGLLPLTFFGWMLVRLLEGRRYVLLTLERWTLGFLLGVTTAMIVQFACAVGFAVPFTLAGFAGVQAVLLMTMAGMMHWRKLWKGEGGPVIPSHASTPRWLLLLLTILFLWTGIKIALPSVVTVLVPPTFDDTVKNWNLRAKVFYEEKQPALRLPTQRAEDMNPNGISSYPPAVSLAKTWLVTLRGSWDEGLVNALHPLWLLAALSLLFCMLRRTSGLAVAMAGVYVLASLPLYLMHGTNAYADVFLSAHLLAAVSMLYSALFAEDESRRFAFLRLAACAIALMPFTKNEGLVLYFPVLLAASLGVMFMLARSGRISMNALKKGLLMFAVLAFLAAVPWTAYKWMSGLTFGNAKGLLGLQFSWQQNVLLSMWINTFFEGNWLLLFSFFIVLVLIFSRRILRTPPLLLLVFIILSVEAMQIPLYLFTGFSTEVLYQTGFARGLIHIAPLVVAVVVLLGAHFLHSPAPSSGGGRGEKEQR